MADLQKQVKKLALKQAEKITDKDIFLSPKFKTYLQTLADSMLMRIKFKPTLMLVYNAENESDIAYTSGKHIHLNGANAVSNVYDLQGNRFLALLGILFHECAHILYLDFDAEKKICDDMEKDGIYYGEFETTTEAEEQTAEEVKEAMGDERLKPIFAMLYHQLSNIFADVHDEGKACNEFHGLVERGIALSTEALRSRSESVEKMTADYTENPTPQGAIELMFSLILRFARYGELVIENDEQIQDNEFIQNLNQISSSIERGSTTDSLEERYTSINTCIMTLWKYISEFLNDDEQSSGDSSDSDNSQSNGQNTSGQGGSNGSNQSDSGQDNSSKTGSNETGSDNNNSDGNGSDTSNSGNSQSNQDISQKVQEIMNAIQNAGQKAVPNTAPQPKEVSTSKAAKDTGNESEKSSAMSEEEAKQIVQAIISQIKQNIAQDEAEKEVEKAMESEINVIVQTVDMTTPHKGKMVNTHRDLTVTQENVSLYNHLMADLLPISRTLQRKMLSILKDLKSGDVQRHRIFGSKLDARDMYKVDSKFFSKKKLPQNLPDMAISVLVDMSGSMRGERITATRKATMLLYDFARGLNIPIMVAGHCTEHGFHYYRYAEFDSVNDKDRYRLAQIEAKKAGNRDGMAMCISMDMLSKRPESIKLFIIISDGQPADYDYGGSAAVADMQEIVKKYKRKGVQTFAAAIGSDRDRIRNIYKDGYLDITDLNTLPKLLVNLVKKRIV